MAEALHPLEGIGIWTEWDDSQAIDDFYAGPIRSDFLRYAKETLGRARYRIVQLRDGKIEVRNFPEESP